MFYIWGWIKTNDTMFLQDAQSFTDYLLLGSPKINRSIPDQHLESLPQDLVDLLVSGLSFPLHSEPEVGDTVPNPFS